MQAEIRENTTIKESWSVIHPLSPEDSTAMTTLRSAVAAMKGKLEGVSARGPFNGIMERVAIPDGVSFKADTVGRISGWWPKPARVRKGAAILHLHGDWFSWEQPKRSATSLATLQWARERMRSSPISGSLLSIFFLRQ